MAARAELRQFKKIQGEVLMNPEELRTTKAEETISLIGAKVAEAVQLSQEAKMLSNNSENILIDIQKRLEEFYISVDDLSE